MAVTATPAAACAGLGSGAAAASQLSRSLERLLEEAALSGELRLSGRKLRELPRRARDLHDTVRADLSRNRLGEVPEEVTTYLYLERLLLAHNAIRSAPAAIGGLHSLTYLDLSGNQLTEVPREVCLLPLEVLLLADNRLTALPKDVGKLSALAELDAARNRLAHVPLSVGDLASLRALDLSDNCLSLLPLQVTYLKLETLDVSCNSISSLPLELRHMASLVRLRLDHNPLVSPPTTVCMRGRVHIFKYLESLANKESVSTRRAADEARRATKHVSLAPAGGGGGGAAGGGGGGGGGTLDCLRRARHVDSGYITSDADRRSHDVGAEVYGGAADSPGSALGSGRSTPSTPSTLSPGAALSRAHSLSSDSPLSGLRTSPEGPATNGDDKGKLSHQQTYRQYKEALRQQRQQDVYRPRGDPASSSPDTDSPHSQPHSPLHKPHSPSPSPLHLPHRAAAGHSTPNSSPLPTSPLLASTPRRFQAAPHAANGHEAHRGDENRRPVQKVVPSRNINRTTLANGGEHQNGRVPSSPSPDGDAYVKPVSPAKSPTASGIPTLNGEAKLLTTTVAYLRGASSRPAAGARLAWGKEVPPDKLSFTMKREFDKQKEELDLLQQLRTIIETRLKMSLPLDLAPVLADGVVLCHLANHVRARAVASVHVPSPAQPKLTMARCRRNVDNFLEACRKIGVEEEEICSAEDILCHHPEGEGEVDSAAPLARTLAALLERLPAPAPPPPPPRYLPLHVHTGDPHRYGEEDGRAECRIDYFRKRSHRGRDALDGCGFDEADEWQLNSKERVRSRVHLVTPYCEPRGADEPDTRRRVRAAMTLDIHNKLSASKTAPENSALVTALCLGGFLLTALLLLLFPPQ